MNNILFRFEKITDASFKVLYTVETDNLKSFAGISGSVSMTLELNIFISKTHLIKQDIDIINVK